MGGGHPPTKMLSLQSTLFNCLLVNILGRRRSIFEALLHKVVHFYILLWEYERINVLLSLGSLVSSQFPLPGLSIMLRFLHGWFSL